MHGTPSSRLAGAATDCRARVGAPDLAYGVARDRRERKMTNLSADIYTEPEPDVDTLKNLGPLTRLAGVWRGTKGVDLHPAAEGPEQEPYVEHYELQPIDPQTNGPQLLYGLRYHVHIVRPDDVETFHDQVGYWLWEPATGTIFHTLAIPRAQVAMAVGQAAADATRFRVEAVHGSLTNGIVSNPFLEQAFKTTSWTLDVTLNADGTWSYEQDTVLVVSGQPEPFHHTDKNTLTKIAEPTPNPLARSK
jgi:hypothetical protein